MHWLRHALLLALLLSPAGFAGGPMESDWLELVKGYKESTMGAEIREIEDGDTADTQQVTIAIPKTAIGDPGAIEEVLVMGRRPDAPEASEPIDITFEWVDDYDNDNYGLVIRFGRDSNWPIRLFMNADAGFTR